MYVCDDQFCFLQAQDKENRQRAKSSGSAATLASLHSEVVKLRARTQ